MIVERYRVISIIGQGGMGTILKATDTLLNLDVAMKVMAVDYTGTNAARLQREASSAGKLSHPNIARIYEFGQTPDGSPYMVMELLSGMNLAQFIEQNGSLTYTQAIPIFRQIASALDLAHRNNLIHRDLKPSNIMLVEQMSGEYQVKLLDFGVAKTQLQNMTITATGAMVGSPLYASPEQASGEEIDPRSDIYSFGVLMFEVLNGKPPFTGATALETLSMHKKTKPPLLSSIVPPLNIPNILVELVDRCLQKEKDKRPAAMQEISAVLSSEMDESIIVDDGRGNRLRQKKILTAATVLGCILTATSLYIYSPAFLKKEKIKVLPEAPKKKSVPSNWYAITNYRKQGDNDESKFRVFKESDPRIENTIYDITDDDFKELEGKNIIKMQLVECTLSGKAFRYLKNSNLRSLKLKSVTIPDDGIKEMTIFKDLVSLEIDSQTVSDKAIQYINQFKKLKLLNLTCPQLTDKGITMLDLPELERLTLLTPNITDISIESLKKSKKLDDLALLSLAVSKNIGITLSELPNLRNLTLSGLRDISSESLQAMAKMKLITLMLRDCLLNDEHFDTISEMKTLRRLDFKNTQVSASNLAKLSKLSGLCHMSLSGNKIITDSMMEELIKLKLQIVDFRLSGIKRPQLRQLIKMKTLKMIYLGDCENLSSEAVQDFVRDFEAINNTKLNVDARDVIEKL